MPTTSPCLAYVHSSSLRLQLCLGFLSRKAQQKSLGQPHSQYCLQLRSIWERKGAAKLCWQTWRAPKAISLLGPRWPCHKEPSYLGASEETRPTLGLSTIPSPPPGLSRVLGTIIAQQRWRVAISPQFYFLSFTTPDYKPKKNSTETQETKQLKIPFSHS